MGLSKKSAGKNSDKETQSPVTKVFREIMHRERNTDPEKANLLKEKDERKKKRCNKSRNRLKTDHISNETSLSEHRHGVQLTQQQTCSHEKTESTPFSSGKKESYWWAWGATDDKESQACSCASCALKKLVGSPYAGIGCLMALLAVTVIVAFVIVFKTLPEYNIMESKMARDDDKMASARERRSDVNFGGRKIWDESKAKLLRGLSDLYGTDFSGTNSRDSSLLGDPGKNSHSDLASILDVARINEGYSSESLRNFYKKLIQTDIQIKNLKKDMRDVTTSRNLYSDFNMLNRYKRALRGRKVMKGHQNHRFRGTNDTGQIMHGKVNLGKFHLFYPPFTANKHVSEIPKLKRSVNGSNATGFVFEKKKIVIEYEPSEHNNKVAKCSHFPKGIYKKEKHLNLPYFKNSERFDDLLNNLFNKDLHEIAVNPFRLQTSTEKAAEPGESANRDKPTVNGIVYKTIPVVNVSNKPLYKQKNDVYSDTDGDYYNKINEIPKDSRKLTTKEYVTLHVSTLINNGAKKSNIPLKSPHDRSFNVRKLMQAEDMDEENLGYEDLNEVLADDIDSSKDKETSRYRKRRADEADNVSAIPKSNIYGNNWKGSMSLYPDELNTIIKQAVLQNCNIDFQTKRDVTNSINNEDINHSEDYFNDKYGKTAKMAQAYSDYGVLDEKKDMERNKKNGKVDHRIKLSVAKGFGLHSNLQKGAKISTSSSSLSSSSASSSSIKPSTYDYMSKENINQLTNSILKIIRKHVNLKSVDGITYGDAFANYYSTTLAPHSLEMIYNNMHEILSTTNKSPADGTKIFENIFSVGKHKRTLKSVDSPDDHFNSSSTEEQGDERLFIKNTTIGSEKILPMISHFFRFLTGFELIRNKSDGNNSSINIVNFIEERLNLNNNTVMFEDIRRKSRKLLSIEEKTEKNVEEVTLGDSNFETKSTMAKRESRNIIGGANTTRTKVNNKIANISTGKYLNASNETKFTENKTIVKRNAAGSNLIFWNDIYDDEYGIQDPLENTVKDKDSKDVDILTRSEEWIGDKFRKIANTVKGTKDKRVLRKVTLTGHRKDKRADQILDDDSDRKSFAALTANMKKVCKEAADAVHQTKNIEVRSNSKENEVATTLMQQLVKLMSELVDFQVQQRTCMQLPDDLHNYLVWLTDPNEKTMQKTNLRIDDADKIGNIDNLDPYAVEVTEQYNDLLSAPNERQDLHPDVRSECLGTIDAVQDLITQYDDMSEEDKSKMSGVREYLETQLDFLHKQLTHFDEYSQFSLLYGNKNINKYTLIRKKRKVSIDKTKKALKKGKRKFIKSFGKKHTRSTNYDAVEVITVMNKNIIGDKMFEGRNEKSDKRNIKDFNFKVSNIKNVTASKSKNK